MYCKISSKKQKAEVDKRRKLDFFYSSSSASRLNKQPFGLQHFSFESTTEIRPERICRRCSWPSSFHTWTCHCCTLNNFYKKSRRSVTCKLATLIWSSSCLFTRQQIRVRLVSLTHQSHMACIHLSYCYARQKFGSSMSAGGFIALISQSNAVSSRKK